ncbi:MAG: TonB-dependent receptor [Sediminicola sp.]
MEKPKNKFFNGRYYMLLLSCMLAWASSLAQTSLTVSGTVYDESGSAPLPGVNVVVEGKSIGTTTDFDGNYSLTVESSATLVFSYLGFVTSKMPVSGKTQIDISLQPDVQMLDDVVVIGYGAQSRAEITSAISSLKGTTVDEVPTPTLTSVLQGKLTGVRVLTNSGQPGNQLNVRIRGGSSITASNNPLYIVDGFPRSIEDINVQDIESMEVLKDASAASIYGARASNGVVLITTRRGKEGKTDLNFHYSYGTQEFPRLIDKLSSRQFLEIMRPAIQESSYVDGQYLNGIHSTGTANGDTSPWSTRFLESGESIPLGYESMIDPVTGRTLIFQENNLQEVLFKTAPVINYYLSANGGSEKLKYAAGFGFTDQEGVAIGSEYKRYSGRINVDYQINDKLSFNTLTDFSYSETNAFDDEATLFSRGAHLAPTLKTEMPDGSPSWGLNSTLSNPEWLRSTRDNNVQRTFATVGLGATWEILDDLKFNSRANYQLNLFQEDYFEKAHVFDGSRSARAQRNQEKSGQIEFTLTYDKTFGGKHSLNALLGYTNLYLETDNMFGRAFGASTDAIPTLNAAPNKEDVSTFRSDEKLISQFGRLFYNYDYKYLLSASVRRDGSSVFGSDSRYGVFPSFSVGWVISKEKFVSDSRIGNVFSNIKLRGSWGQTGNNDVGRYQSQGDYSATFSYAGNPGILATEMPNSGLGWETTTQLNLGIDLSFMNEQRIYATAEYFKKNTDNLLFSLQLPRETGFDNIQTNIGSVEYSGFEFSLGARIIDNETFKWTSDFNISYITNEVTKLPEREGIDKNRINGLIFDDGTGIGGIAEGEPLGNLLGYRVDFLIDNQQQADNAHYDQDARGYDPSDGTEVRGRKFPGDFEWVDRNGDDMITVQDQFVLGNSEPTTFGGFNNKFEYKGFDFTIFLDFALGHSIIDLDRGWWNGNGARELSPTTDVLNAWQQPGDAAHTNWPRISFHDPQGQLNHFRPSDFYTYKADYLSIRDIRLGYSFSDKIINQIGFISSLRIYFGGNNLHYFTKYPGYSPEAGGAVRGGGNYPTFRTFVSGIKLGF